MDTVRFGRALGFGTRQAIKTLVSAVDAAAADSPSPGKSAPAPASPIPASPIGPDSAARRATASAAKAPPRRPRTAPVKQRVAGGTRRFGQAVWEPFVRLSGVLWLEVTGVFFGLFALIALSYLWKLRAAWHAGAADAASRNSSIFAAIMFALFGYFCVSSFVRARRRERKR
ncbi:MAG TPA: hypothetical protein VGU23_01575 [Acidobacteriaceae bacterium]|nr:hypothetical protein [Acidobacteriaceae bacterium]